MTTQNNLDENEIPLEATSEEMQAPMENQTEAEIIEDEDEDLQIEEEEAYLWFGHLLAYLLSYLQWL